MSERRTNEPIATWQAGDSVSGFALLTQKERRQDRTGNNYLNMELADASGRIAAKAWSDSPAVQGDFEAPGFVAFKGMVKLFRDELQMNVDDCRQAGEEDRQYGFDPDTLIPSTPEDPEDLWRRLEAAVGRIEHPMLARLAQDCLADHGAQLRRHPAAKTVHHDYRGGLLEHTVSMMELVGPLCDHYPELDRDLLTVAVLFHDLGKIHEMGELPGSPYTAVGALVGHVVIGHHMLRTLSDRIEDFPPELLMRLEHLVLSHQGQLEYGSPVRPATPDAFALHAIDDLDSKLNQLRKARALGSDLQWIKRLGRSVYFGEAPEDVPADEDLG